jgi:uncharacterized coiled-coil protein SlyX
MRKNNIIELTEITLLQKRQVIDQFQSQLNSMTTTISEKMKEVNELQQELDALKAEPEEGE